MRLREATPADLPALTEVSRRCDLSHRAWAGDDLPETPVARLELDWHERFARHGSWAVLVEEDSPGGPSVLGACAFATARQDHHQGPLVPDLAHVSAVFVDPDHWRRGIARLMLDAAEAAMRERGHERARLHTLVGSPAEALYRALGWERTGLQSVYPPFGLPTVQYVKDLRAG